MNRQPSQQPESSRQQSRQTPSRDRPFVASRMPLGGENTPYSRPVPRGTQPPPPPAQRSGTSSQGSERVLETCLQLLKEIRQGVEEQKKIKDAIKTVSSKVNNIEEKLLHLNEAFKDYSHNSFTIESSCYKDGLTREVGKMYAISLERMPKVEDVGTCIAKVLRDEAKDKVKFNKAKTFCLARLTDLRCEERRRLLGNKPCESFPNMATSNFAERFLTTIKAPMECYNIYLKNLALLRKFSRECAAIKHDTFKVFREWLKDNFILGCPSESEWEAIIKEDEDFNYELNYIPENIQDIETLDDLSTN